MLNAFHFPLHFFFNQKEVHLWIISFEKLDLPPAELHAQLSEDERIRAQGFFFQKDAESFVYRRALLRLLLGSYLQQDPATIQLCYSPQGKPFVNGSGQHHLKFSLSFSERMLLFAFTRNLELGVDIEAIHPLTDLTRLVESFFTAREIKLFHKLPEARRLETFYSLWTGKEACIKALDKDLSWLSHFDMTFLARPSRHFEHHTFQHLSSAPISFYSLPFDSIFCAALAVCGDPETIIIHSGLHNNIQPPEMIRL